MLDQTQELRRNERLRAQARVNPWKDVWEFESVGEALLLAAELENESMEHNKQSTIIVKLEEALRQVDIWKLRTSTLPHAIESTAAFARIIARDVQGTISSSELRLAYASAILRAINGLADVLQQQRVHAASVAVLCQQLGIPSWLVTVRHESTHNQLPSLAVLRLSSKSLLCYFRQVYWDPLARVKLDHLNDASALLQAYHKAALQIVVANDEPEEVLETEPLVNKEPSDTKQQPSNDTQLTSMMISPFQSKLGTSFNSFAVLQSTSKKTKEKRKKPKRKSTASKKQKMEPQNIKIVHNASGKSACPALGQVFAKANVPLDILRYELLSYLIWKGPEFEEMNEGGVLFAGAYDQGIESFELLKQRYLPLIQAACRAWPGFLTTILVHIIDALLSTFFLEQWVSCLLSKESILQTFPSLAPELKGYTLNAVIQSNAIQSLQIPLNSLCDRCEDEGSSDPSSSSYSIARLFREMLGSDRVNHFAAGSICDSTPINRVEQVNDVCQNEDKPTVPGGLSLEEMEKLLGEKSGTLETEKVQSSVGNGMAAENDVDTTPDEPDQDRTDQAMARKCWVRCTNWDACAIGSLPGHPQ